MSKLSGITDTSKCPATPIVPPIASQERGSTVTSQAMTSQQSHSKQADSIIDILFPATVSQVSELQTTRDMDEQRQNSLTSPRPLLKGSKLTPLSFNRESVFASTSLPVTSSRRSPSSPGASTREPNAVSAQHPTTSRHHVVSKDSFLDVVADSMSVNIGHREDSRHSKAQPACSHRLSSFPYRDIFSPIPSEHIGDEVLRDFSNAATWRRHAEDAAAEGFTDPSFPAIKVEDCDEGGLGSGISILGNKDFGSMKKSATTPGNFLSEFNQSKQDRGCQKTTSLDVPSSYIKWRNAEGRLIAALNEDLLTGALSRLCSRSEGNIPSTVQDSREYVYGMDSNVSKAENNSSLSRQFSRHVTHYSPINSSRSSNSSPLMNAGRKERILTPTLQTGSTSGTKFSFSSGTLGADVKKTPQFMSPQPQRRHGPRY